VLRVAWFELQIILIFNPQRVTRNPQPKARNTQGSIKDEKL
jgi:hypothetical protein